MIAEITEEDARLMCDEEGVVIEPETTLAHMKQLLIQHFSRPTLTK